ncbi:DUF2726 domain-containing protein [candidate division KSB1 bacterium]
MEKIYILAFIILVAGFVAQFIRGKDKDITEKKGKWLPYIKKQYLLTQSEHKFFDVLEKASENKYYIFPQIVLSNIVQLKGKGSLKGGYRSKINKKTVDFVLFDKQDISPILVIELDDYTHKRPSRKRRDNFVNDVLEHCSIPILHVMSIPDEKELKTQIDSKINTD